MIKNFKRISVALVAAVMLVATGGCKGSGTAPESPTEEPSTPEKTVAVVDFRAICDKEQNSYLPKTPAVTVTLPLGIYSEVSEIGEGESSENGSVFDDISFVDADGNTVAATEGGHIVMSNDGGVVFDVDVKSEISGIACDYDGNIWFVTDGDTENAVGYLERGFADKVIGGDVCAVADAFIHYVPVELNETLAADETLLLKIYSLKRDEMTVFASGKAGAARVDIAKTEDETFEAEEIWARDDISFDVGLKFAAETGYCFGYTDAEKDKLYFVALEKDSGEVTLRQAVESAETTKIQDRFVYLKSSPKTELDVSGMERSIVTDKEFRVLSGQKKKVASYLMSVTFDTVKQENVAFRVSGLSGNIDSFGLFCMNTEGELKKISLSLYTEEDVQLKSGAVLEEDTVYEVRVRVSPGDDYDLVAEDGTVKLSIILAK